MGKPVYPPTTQSVAPFAEPDGWATLRRYPSEQHHHHHHHTQLLFCLSGQLDLEIEQHGFALGSGQGVWIAPEDTHGFAGKLNPLCLVLDIAAAPGIDRSSRQPQSLGHTAQHHLQQLCRRLTAQPDDPLLQRRLQQEANTHLGLTPPSRKRQLDFVQIDDWIEQRLAQPITVSQLASACHWSAAHFRERFTAEVGLSPSRLIQRRRSRLAYQRLQTGQSVASVAMQCGYQSPSALTAMLKDTLGLTPRDIMRQTQFPHFSTIDDYTS